MKVGMSHSSIKDIFIISKDVNVAYTYKDGITYSILVRRKYEGYVHLSEIHETAINHIYNELKAVDSYVIHHDDLEYIIDIESIYSTIIEDYTKLLKKKLRTYSINKLLEI